MIPGAGEGPCSGAGVGRAEDVKGPVQLARYQQGRSAGSAGPGSRVRRLTRSPDVTTAAIHTRMPPMWRTRSAASHPGHCGTGRPQSVRAAASKERASSAAVCSPTAASMTKSLACQQLAFLTADDRSVLLPDAIRRRVCWPGAVAGIAGRSSATPRLPTSALGGRLPEGLIHHQDIRRALGLPRAIPPERLLPALRTALIAPRHRLVPPIWAFRSAQVRRCGMRPTPGNPAVVTDRDPTVWSGSISRTVFPAKLVSRSRRAKRAKVTGISCVKLAVTHGRE
jgi:hypothetical protein